MLSETITQFRLSPLFPLALAFAGITTGAGQQATQHNEQPARELHQWELALKWSASEQAAWIQAYLDRGTRQDTTDTFATLVVARSSVALPLMEKKIEQVLASTSPSDCFTDKSVDPKKWVGSMAGMIDYAGDEESLRQASKLIKLDEKLFGDMVERTMFNALTRRTPYSLAYAGLEIGDPAIDKRVVSWVEARLADKTSGGMHEVRQLWAEAMVDKYGGAPTEAQWANDRIVSRLHAPLPSLVRVDMERFAKEAVEKRAKK